MSEDRRLEVLRAIVQDYVPDLRAGRLQGPAGASPARGLRRDRAQRHGRARGGGPHHRPAHERRPDADRRGLPAVRRPAAADQAPQPRRARRHRPASCDGALDLDDVVSRTTRLLSSLTQQVAVMQYPSLSRSTLRHVELVPVGGTRLMIVLITSTGRVEQRVVDVGRDLALEPDVVASLRTLVNELAVGQAARPRPRPPRRRWRSGSPPPTAPWRRSSWTPWPRRRRSDRGAHRDGRHRQPGPGRHATSPTSLSPVLEALEEHVVLLRLMGSMASLDDGETVAVASARRTPTSRCGPPPSWPPPTARPAAWASLGPTRMDYPQAMATVRAVAHYVADILDG